ncbi:MAG TPA: Uma2 family endonuclease [Armatimonadota bacterium]|nr:Uma2 family endonuclease [Armatimonadota bacterium]
MSAEIAPHPEKLYTVEEFFELTVYEKADLIEGVIYVASTEPILNDDLTFLIRYLMTDFAESRDLGRIHGNRVAFVFGPRCSVEPDVAFIATARLGILTPEYVSGAPDIAVEITGDESRSRDYDDKRRLYGSAGVREYWLIDPDRRSCYFYLLRDARYEPATLENGRIFRSEVLPGFWLDAEWFFTDPIPDPAACLQQILAGPPPQST